MLIIPVEDKLNWKRPPVITLLLITINCFIFFNYQIKDSEILNSAMSNYQDSRLWELEKNLYMEFLEKNKVEVWRFTATDSQSNETQAIQQMLHDHDFSTYIHQNPKYQSTDWKEKRSPIEAQINSISYIKYGFNPAQPSWTDAFVSMFLHGDFAHLLGNMTFLFLFGFALESLLGAGMYITTYLITGLCATALYWAAKYGVQGFSIGASGAISGLMGAYLAAYRFKRIQFFYWIGPYFNYLKAPALIIFPLWFGKELYGQLTSTGNVNYWTHIGGLLSGLAVVLALSRIRPKPQTTEEPKSANTRLITQLNRLDRLIEKLYTEQAIQLCQSILLENPKSTELLSRYFRLTRHNKNKLFHQLVVKIIQLPDGPAEKQLVREVTQEYCSPKQPDNLVCIEKAINFWLRRLIKDHSSLEALQLATLATSKKDPAISTIQLAIEVATIYQNSHPELSRKLRENCQRVTTDTV